MTHPPIPFGIMFHHFHDDKKHPFIQGSIDAVAFRETLTGVPGINLMRANDWIAGYKAGTLKPTDACITFDDALRSQYDIALPVLEEMGLTAFWFVYSSVFEGVIDMFEITRYFRNVAYATVDDFHTDFFAEMAAMSTPARPLMARLESKEAKAHLHEHKFYTERDRQFRYIRDHVLSVEEFCDIIKKMMQKKNFDFTAWTKNMWMDDETLRYLDKTGHVVGLHSYSHPVNFRRLDLREQVSQYFKNALHMQRVLGRVPHVMAHPSNSYDEKTLEILCGMGIDIGFRANAEVLRGTNLEIARIDSLEYRKLMQKQAGEAA